MAEQSNGLKDMLDDYLERSSTASTIARNSGFAGIAIIWLFKGEASQAISLPNEFILPLIYLIVFLVVDFLHYFLGAIVGGITHRLASNDVTAGRKQEADVEFPDWFSTLNWIIWFSKMIPFLIGYYLLLSHLLNITNSA